LFVCNGEFTEGGHPEIDSPGYLIGIIYMGIGERQHYFLQAVQVFISAGQSDEFLKTYNIRVFGMNIINYFLQGSGVLVPLVIIKNPDIIGKQPNRSLCQHRFGFFGLKLEELSQRIPSQGNAKNGNQEIPFSEGDPKYDKEQIKEKDKRVGHTDKSEYPGINRTDIY